VRWPSWLVATASENRLTDHQSNGAMDFLHQASAEHFQQSAEFLRSAIAILVRSPFVRQTKSQIRLPSCESVASIGNNRANAISENEPNYEPDCEGDCEVRHHMT
jgi:hypothetical protein